MTNKYIKMASPKWAGKLVGTWMAFAADPHQKDTLDAFGREVEQELLYRLPEGRLNGILNGYECEIRQETQLMLFGRFFAGNKRLINATKIGWMEEVDNQLRRSISAAVNITRHRMVRRRLNEIGNWVVLDERNGGICMHTSMRSMAELPFELQMRLAVLALKIGISRKRISKSSAVVADLVLRNGISQSGVARRLGISRAAVHFRMRSVHKYLPAIIAEQEIPSIND